MRTIGFAIKRLLDVLAAVMLLVLLSPVILVVTLLVRRRLGAPALFRQVRPGRHGRPFTLVKFRTMRDAVDAHGAPLPDEQRLTPFGQALRRTSLDELPQLWNVLLGHMSLVGPRPLLTDYLHLYTPRQARRHEVRPGITGWAQVHGRNLLDWPARLEHDVWYVDNWSLLLDLRILLATVRNVVRREGVSAEGEATMARFTGTPTDGSSSANPVQ